MHCAKLGVEQSDAYGVVRKKYFTLAREKHPDNNGHSLESVEEMKEINASWEIVQANHPAFRDR